jgi:uncharacterized protein YbjT (DUF2867 family)
MIDGAMGDVMTDKKTIAVIGATGAQGGGLVRAILADPQGLFAVRAITRSAGSERARALAEAGAEVAEADLADEASLRKAFDGAYGAFVVTNFWESVSAEVELAQAAAAASAAKDAGVQHVIWSTLEDTRGHLPVGSDRYPTLDGYTVPHFDAKAEANALFEQLGVPTTFLQTSFNWENFSVGLGATRSENGRLVLTLPMGERRLAGIAAEDVGRTALGIFARGREYIGATVSVAGEHLTGQQLADAFADAFAEPVDYRPMTHDQFRALPIPGAAEFGNMFQYYYEAEEDFVGARDLDVVRSLNPRLQTFRGWLDAHKEQLRPA